MWATRPFLPAGLTAATLALVLGACGRRTPTPPPPVVLVVVDSLRADHLGCYGYPRPTSPHLDRLAAHATLYRRAISQAPWTTPSFASFLTSRYPTYLGIHEEVDRLSDRFVLLSEALHPKGYATGAVIAHYFIGSQWNFQQGFDVFDESNVVGHRKFSSPGVTESAIRFVDQHADGSFFLLVHYFDPHYFYFRHPGFDFTDPAYDGPVRSGMDIRDLKKMRRRFSPEDLAFLEGLYDSEIAFTDHYLGKLLDHLVETGVFDRALVIFTADHGEAFMDHGSLGHGGNLHRELVRVPLIVKWPGQHEGRRVGRRVALLDLYPTALAAAGVKSSVPMEGTALKKKPPSNRSIFTETDWTPRRALLHDHYKLVWELDPNRFRLYDLEADPSERDDLVPEITARADHLLRPRFAAMREELVAWREEQEREATVAEEVPIDEERAEELRSLGYLE